jgi:hypothetical protein
MPWRAAWVEDFTGVDLFLPRAPEDCLGVDADFVGARFLDELAVVLAGVFFLEIFVVTLGLDVFFAINNLLLQEAKMFPRA